MPIRVRPAIVIMIATALAAAFGGLIFVTTLGHRLHNSLVAELTARADAVSQQLQQAPQITSSPPGGLPDLSDSRSVTQVLDRNETLVASAGLDQGMGLLDRSTLAAAARGPIVRERLDSVPTSWLTVRCPAASD